MNKLLMGACLTMAMQVGHSQTLPQLGKDPIEKIVAAMTAEEKVSLFVGTGMPGFGGQSAVVGSTQNLVPGAAGTTFPIERLGIPAIVVADGPAGLRISPTREGNEATYYCTAFPVATLLASMEHRIGQKRRQRHGRRGERIRLRRTLGPRAEYPPKPSLRT